MKTHTISLALSHLRTKIDKELKLRTLFRTQRPFLLPTIHVKKEVVLIKTKDQEEKDAVMVGEEYWNAIQEVLETDDCVAHVNKNTQRIIDRIFEEDSALLRVLKNL